MAKAKSNFRQLDDSWKFDLTSAQTEEQSTNNVLRNRLAMATEIISDYKDGRLIDMLAFQMHIAGALFDQAQNGDSPKLILDEIDSLSLLVRRLVEHTDKASAFIWQRLSVADQATLSTYAGGKSNGDEATTVVLNTLNNLIEGPSLYNQKCFKKTNLRHETKSLLQQSPTGLDLAKLNRLLLEDAFVPSIGSNQKAVGAISILSELAIFPMESLLRLAEMGSEHAANSAAELLERFVRMLNTHAEKNPQVYRELVQKLKTWPVVYSTHPKLRQDPKRLIKQDELGKETGFELGFTAKWDPNDKACIIALQLYEHIREKWHALSAVFPEARTLPGINKEDSVTVWWKLAEKVFKASFPEPGKNKVLRSLTKIQKSSKVDAKILEIIKSRFVSLFPKQSRAPQKVSSS
jgi:hypothetical protein